MKHSLCIALLMLSACGYTAEPRSEFGPEAVCEAMGYYKGDRQYGACIESEIAARQKLGMR